MAKLKSAVSKKRRGRPPLSPDEGKRYTLSLRVSEERRWELEQAAAESGRSISQELEMRIEQGARDTRILGGPQMTNLFRMMAAAAQLIEARSKDKNWFSDYEVFISVREAWRRIIDAVMPQPSQELVENLQVLKDILAEQATNPGNKGKGVSGATLLKFSQEIDRFQAHLNLGREAAQKFSITPLVPVQRPRAASSDEGSDQSD